MDKYVVIVAGGSGSRMNSDIPKQFLLIESKPILLHSIEKFINAIEGIHLVLVLQKSEWERWENLKKEHSFDYPIILAEGGATRFASVKAGLSQINVSKGIVGIHDSVRPLVTKECIRNCYEQAESKGNAVPVVDLKDSIRMLISEGSVAMDRKNFKLVQTPQCFDLSQLKQAYESVSSDSFTDDASLFEITGQKLNLVKGNEENIKITTKLDLHLAEMLLK